MILLIEQHEFSCRVVILSVSLVSNTIRIPKEKGKRRSDQDSHLERIGTSRVIIVFKRVTMDLNL